MTEERLLGREPSLIAHATEAAWESRSIARCTSERTPKGPADCYRFGREAGVSLFVQSGTPVAGYDAFNSAAERTRALNASSSMSSPSWRSMARLTLPSRLELKRPAGSFREAPLAKVSFTLSL
jgi:hypothetical protein